jgi:DNA-binding NtrC family response regulator
MEPLATTYDSLNRACPDIPILLVEDDDLFRDGLAEALREDGHDVIAYPEPAVLPSLSLLGHVSLLLCDFVMPGQNCLTLADRFHAAHPSVPIVMATGSRTRSLDCEVAARPFMRLLEKPLRYDDLHALVHRVAR